MHEIHRNLLNLSLIACGWIFVALCLGRKYLHLFM